MSASISSQIQGLKVSEGDVCQTSHPCSWLLSIHLLAEQNNVEQTVSDFWNKLIEEAIHSKQCQLLNSHFHLSAASQISLNVSAAEGKGVLGSPTTARPIDYEAPHVISLMNTISTP